MYDPRIHHRRSVRLRGFDYAHDGAYFVTICAESRACIFGEIVSQVARLSAIGEVIESHWHALPRKYPQIELDAFVVIPNHIHGVLWITSVGAGFPRPPTNAGEVRPTLGQIIGFYKYQTTKTVNEQRGAAGAKLWQRSYYDHIMRNDHELDAIREYIATNPDRWDDDAENPAGTGRDDVVVWTEALKKRAHAKVKSGNGGDTPPLRGVADV
jgi:REP element-mobilizing transposase RayT